MMTVVNMGVMKMIKIKIKIMILSLLVTINVLRASQRDYGASCMCF